MNIIDKRMIELMYYAIQHELVDNEEEWCEKIKSSRTLRYAVEKGRQHYTREHMRNACVVTGANMNWLVDIEKEMFRTKGKNKDARQLMREAYAAVDQELAKKKQNLKPVPERDN